MILVKDLTIDIKIFSAKDNNDEFIFSMDLEFIKNNSKSNVIETIFKFKYPTLSNINKLLKYTNKEYTNNDNYKYIIYYSLLESWTLPFEINDENKKSLNPKIINILSSYLIDEVILKMEK